MELQGIAQIIESFAPRELQESYDNAGLQCGDPHMEVSRVLTCLDVTEQVIHEAHERGCQLVVSHHPLLFRGVKVINPATDYISRILMAAIRYGIGIYAAHTNLDKAEGGMNHRLASLLGLTQVVPLSECGVCGQFAQPMQVDAFLSHLQHQLHAPLRCNRDGAEAYRTQGRQVTRLALCTGSGSDFIDEAHHLGCDAYLTGEMHYHSWFGHPDLLIVEAGHFETEQIAPQLLADIITSAAPHVECLCTQYNNSPCLYL